MPSVLHELVVELFRREPALLIRVVRSAGSLMAVPEHDEIRIDSADLGEVVPTERRADLVVLLVRGEPVLVVVLEVQLEVKEEKRRMWPFYTAAASVRHRCPAVLVVYAPRESAARRLSEPIVTLNARFVPVVLGPGLVPRVVDAEEARKDPPAAYLSAVAHGDEPDGMEVVMAALAGMVGLEELERATLADALLATLGEARRKEIEAIMTSPNYEFQTDWAKGLLAKGRAEGLDKGLEKGLEAGLEAGRLVEARSALRRVLARRALTVPPAAEVRIDACTDLPTLERWLDDAIVATEGADVVK